MRDDSLMARESKRLNGGDKVGTVEDKGALEKAR